MASVDVDWVLRREMKLARRPGSGQALIGRLEQGRSLPKIKTLWRIGYVTGSKLVLRLEPG